ncbi:hypothetical protein P7K49_026025 [Saguinus oedipus]|uniref:Uncharacterized protein n=1 Tax=Saguinus oedipus TaxID=9490 RepID=A0ABQ9UIX3_SAGOE|nr:hypothetical protein P7K49_026025 [Saguinus oedipus]
MSKTRRLCTTWKLYKWAIMVNRRHRTSSPPPPESEHRPEGAVQKKGRYTIPRNPRFYFNKQNWHCLNQQSIRQSISTRHPSATQSRRPQRPSVDTRAPSSH